MDILNYFNFGKTKELLVCETDGFSLRGAVLTRSNALFTVLYQTVINNPNMAEALTELVGELRQQGWQGGGKAILLSPAVLSTLVELPVSPKKPRPVLQMMELVRWEVEPLLMQHITKWSVGNLLVRQGYMTNEQANAVMDLQQGNANEAGGLQLADNFTFRKFGDLAEELGYVRRSQISACLSGQEWLKLQSENDVIACGWAAQNEVADVPGMYNWLISCVNHDLLKRWTELFAKEHVQLQSMYPSTGMSALLLPDDVKAAVVLESSLKFNFASHILDGNVISQNNHIDPEHAELSANIEAYHGLNADGKTPIWLADWHNNSELGDELKQVLEKDVHALAMSPMNDVISPAMLAATKHAFKKHSLLVATDVRLDGPPLALFQRVEVRLAVLMLVMMFIVGVMEGTLAYRHHTVMQEKAQVDQRWNVISDATKRVNKQIEEINKRKTLLKQQEQEQVRFDALIQFYDNAVPKRSALVKYILSLIQTHVPEDVIITQVDELGKRVSLLPTNTVIPTQKTNLVEVENINIEAWALSEESAQQFIYTIKDKVREMDLVVKESIVQADKGVFGLDGFTVAFRIVRMMPKDQLTTIGTLN